MDSIYSRVHSLVSHIPPGFVTTYGHIAQALGIKSPRVVGNALHANTDPRIPCHRVVNRLGQVATNYAFGGSDIQRQKLISEGVVFLNNSRVDLKKCLYIL